MRNFIFIVNKKNNDRNGNNPSTVKVYEIVDGSPHVVIPAVRISYRDAQQAAIEELVSAGHVPADMFPQFPVLWQLREQGIINITEVSP